MQCRHDVSRERGELFACCACSFCVVFSDNCAHEVFCRSNVVLEVRCEVADTLLPNLGCQHTAPGRSRAVNLNVSISRLPTMSTSHTSMRKDETPQCYANQLFTITQAVRIRKEVVTS
jgi:hypothetical protein